MLGVSVVSALPSWTLLVVALVIAWRVTKGGGGEAVTELSKANEVLTKRKDELGAEVRDLRAETARLKERTDVATALVPVLAALEAHEQRAAERHTRHLDLLAMIAERLGPDNGH